jgi:hypothetical protein
MSCWRLRRLAPPARDVWSTSRLAGEWDDLAYLNAVDVGRDGGAPAPRKRPSTS